MSIAGVTAFLLASFSLAVVANAADGDLDSAFGASGGYTLTGETATALQWLPRPALLPDGRILLCSATVTGGQTIEDFFVAQFTADGALDSTFNFNGKVTVDFDLGADVCNAVVVQPDGKIVLIGSSTRTTPSINSDFAVARLNADGTLDGTFGGGTGRVTIPFDRDGGTNDEGIDVALQPDHKIVVVGWADDAVGSSDFAVVRLLPDGTRDSSFGTAGRVVIPFDFPQSQDKADKATSVVIDDQGRVLIGGFTEVDGTSYDFAIVRLTPDGSLDPNFNGDGRATVAFDLGFDRNDFGYRLMLQPDGKIIFVGTVDTGVSVHDSNTDAGIARLLPSGALDTTFGVGGKTTVPFDLVANGYDAGFDVVEQPNGSLDVVGEAGVDNVNEVAAVFRLTPNGALDTTFGNFGKRTYSFGQPFSAFTGVLFNGTDLIATGVVQSAAGSDNLVAAIRIDTIFASGFE